MSANGTPSSAGSAGGFTLWFTGLPCAGKTTLAAEVGLELKRRGCRVEVLDADALRTTVCRGLGFDRKDRDENVARIGWICSMLSRHGVVSVAAVVSPYADAREQLRKTIPGFVEIYVKTPLAVCIRRDVKGMYAKAMAGKLSRLYRDRRSYAGAAPSRYRDRDREVECLCVCSIHHRMARTGGSAKGRSQFASARREGVTQSPR